jgi:hypothetical protein
MNVWTSERLMELERDRFYGAQIAKKYGLTVASARSQLRNLPLKIAERRMRERMAAGMSRNESWAIYLQERQTLDSEKRML